MEEVMLQGLVIGCAKTDTEERLALVTGFVPRIDNWAVCDSVCAGLKFGKKDAERVWDFLKVYFDSDKEYGIRFAVVMFLFHYIDGAYAARGLESLAPIRHEGYYVKMAVAWAVSVCYVKFPSVALPYLQNNAFDIVTHNKALQKILESRRMSRDDEVLIRSLKRKPPPKQSGGGGG
jgi:3-methyladenine DNA glycosylase AlkD